MTGGRSAHDAGLTLAELLVSLALLAVISPLAVGMVTRISTQTKATLASSANIGDARLALAYVERQVRSGNQPLAVTASTLNLNTCSDQSVPNDLGWVRVVEFRINSGALETRSYRASTTPGTWRSLIAHLAPASGFAASGAGAVRVTVSVTGADGKPADGDTVVGARNAALSTPLPAKCPSELPASPLAVVTSRPAPMLTSAPTTSPAPMLTSAPTTKASKSKASKSKASKSKATRQLCHARSRCHTKKKGHKRRGAHE
jgi:prepilin-type N-terminal cleavage/methylation domain-containing protein